MKFYRVGADCNGSPYFATLHEAKVEAIAASLDSYDDIEVEAIDVATDKANILRLLNVAGGTDTPLGTVWTAKAKRK